MNFLGFPRDTTYFGVRQCVKSNAEPTWSRKARKHEVGWQIEIGFTEVDSRFLREDAYLHLDQETKTTRVCVKEVSSLTPKWFHELPSNKRLGFFTISADIADAPVE